MYRRCDGVIRSRHHFSLLRWAVLIAIIGVMLGSEIAITREVFASAYNFYHLLGL